MATSNQARNLATTDSGQQAFASALQKKLTDVFSSQLDGTFSPMNVSNGFYWGIQFGPNNYYNSKSLNQMELQAVNGSNGIMTIDGANFITTYNGILNNIIYGFSDADQAKLDQEAKNTASQMQAVISSWENDNGAPITQSDITDSKCHPATKLGYIFQQVQDNWNGDINKIPSLYNSFRVAYQNYKVAAQISFQLYSASAAAMSKLSAARANSLNPSATNGGLQTAANSYSAAIGPFPTQNKINGDLQTLSNKAEISLSLSKFSSKSTSLSVSGGAAISIPILDFLSLDLGGSASYSLDTFTSSSSTVEMTITYEGITFVGVPVTDGNLSTNNTTGWYDNHILMQAVGNTDQKQTGYSLQGSEYPVNQYFGAGKEFSRIKTWVISQQPKISMKFCNADTNAVTSKFKEHSEASVKLFGIFGIGSVSQDYSVSKVDTDTSTGCVTVEMGPSKVIGTTPANDSSAYVIGGVASYPPNDI